MEELILHDQDLPLVKPTKEKGFGEPWEEIDQKMRKNLNLPTTLSNFKEEGGCPRERVFSQVDKNISRQIRQKDNLVRERGECQEGDTKKILKIIRSITSQNSCESYRESYSKRNQSGECKQKTNLLMQSRRKEQVKFKELKLKIPRVLQLPTSNIQNARVNHRFPSIPHLHLGKQNCATPLNVLNIIHEECQNLEQTAYHFPLTNSITIHKERKPSIRRYRSQEKYDKLPAINLAQQVSKQRIPTIHASPHKSRLSYQKALRLKQKSSQKHTKRVPVGNLLQLGKKYKLFLNPQSRPGKLQLLRP